MYKLPRQFEMSAPAAQLLEAPPGADKKPYDPELIYVECRVCGRPVLWEPGRTTALLAESGVNPASLDEQCLILSDGCRACSPEKDGFQLSIVRLSGVPMSSFLLMQKPKGNA